MAMTFRDIRPAAHSPQTSRGNGIFCQSKSENERDRRNQRANSRFQLQRLPFRAAKSLHCLPMSVPPQPNVKLTNAPDYRESYANSVQMRVNVWDFFLVFGTVQQQSETQVEVRNFQGIYLSPQQAKALLGLLQQNVSGYETAFGEIKLDPRMASGGQVH
jgi:flagellar protein FlaG